MVSTLLDRLFAHEKMDGDGRCPTYLYRWTLFQPRWPARWWNGFGIYLHQFVGDDWSLDVHDHPKRFISIGLVGEYIESVADPHTRDWKTGHEDHVHRKYRAPWVRTFPATHAHRITLPDHGRPCWTLCIVLRHEREWGFWNKGRWIFWKRYVRSASANERRSCL